MDPKKAIVLVVALVALVALAFLWAYRGGGSLELSLPFETEVRMQGENQAAPSPGAIVGEDLQAGGDLNAGGKTGGDVELRRATAEGSINITTETQEGGTDPKH